MKHSADNPVSWVPTLYFAMGLPFVVLNTVAAVMFKDMGAGNGRITFWTSLIMWPWTVKFLWSPAVELFRTKKFFVVTTQILSGVLFGLAAMALHLPSFFAVTVAIFAVVAFSGATHDIAADGVYMSVLDTRQQARYIGWQGAFYNLAKLVATGGLVWFAGWLGDRFAGAGKPAAEASADAWSTVLTILCAVLMVLGAYHWRILPSGGTARQDENGESGHAARTTGEVIRTFFAKRHIWFYIAFIIIYRLGEGLVMKIVPLFLKSDAAAGGLGLTNQQIGLCYGTFGAAAFLTGSLLAGYYISHRGLRRTLFTLCCAFNIPFAAYVYLAWAQPQSLWLIGGSIVAEYFGYGFGFVGLMLFMMQQVAPGKHPMAHYAFASAIMNFGFMIPGMVSGLIYQHIGYESFFTLALVLSIPSFILAAKIPFAHSSENTPQTQE